MDGLNIGIGNVSLAEETAGYAAGSLGYTGFMYVNPRAFNGDVAQGLWNGNTDGQILVTYSNAGLTIGAATSDNAAGDQRNVFAASYAFADYTVAVTMQDSDDRDQDFTSLYFGGKIQSIGFGLYADDYKNGTNGYGVTASFSASDALTIAVTATLLDDGVAGNDDESYGIGANYNLGGGVSVGGGVASLNGSNYAEVGLVFNF